MTSHSRTFSRSWPVQDAKARFSELLNASTVEGPQVITRRGVDTAVLVPIDEWKRLRDATKSNTEQTDSRPTLKELLLTDPRRFELDIPPRGRFKPRPVPEFD